VTAAAERQLATFGPPQPASTADPDTWIARLGELPLLAQPGERWLYQSGSQVLGVLAGRAAGAPFEDVLRSRVFSPLGMDDTGFHAADTARLSTAYGRRDGMLVVADPPEGQWSQPPAFPDGGAGLVSSVDDMVAFGRMLLRGGSPVLKSTTVAEMTRDQLTPEQRGNVWPGFSFLGDRGWGHGVAVLDDGRYTWDGVRDAVVERAVTGPHRRGAHPAGRRGDRAAGCLRRRAGGPQRRFRLLAVMRS
jgi:CubicO group peptidase (beta-lactamase class C family)